jgi:hypothetical protein
MSVFESTTVHYTTKNGETKGTRERVLIRGKKGTKTMEEIDNRNMSKESEPLTQKEIKHILSRSFIPNLFSRLHMRNQTNLMNLNNNSNNNNNNNINNNNNNNKNNNKNNKATRRRSASQSRKAGLGYISKIDLGNASKKKTQKRRRQ